VDKETAVELERLRAESASQRKAIGDIESDIESWKKLATKAIIKSVTWLLATGLAGLAYGLHIPENIKKRLIEWLQQ
jgi:hypothetical protein